jgi:hypothetical protein
MVLIYIHLPPVKRQPLYGQDSLEMVAIGGGKILVQEDWRQPHILDKTPCNTMSMMFQCNDLRD